MDHLIHYLKKEVSYSSNSGTMYIPLPKDAKISLLMLEVDMTVAGTAYNEVSILDRILKIHVILDGAKHAYTMKPEVASFDYMIRSGQHPPHELSSRPTAEDIMRLPILFGRFPGDKEYGLDTGLYGSAVLEVEYSLSTTYHDTGTTDLTAWILTPVDPVTYRGFIRARIIEDAVNPTQSSDHTVEFPSTFPLLAAFVRIFDLNEYPYNNITDIDFQADQGRHRIFDGRIEDLFMLNDLYLGYPLEGPRICHSVASDDEPLAHMGLMRDWRLTMFNAGDGELTSTSWKGHDFKISSTWGATVKSCFLTAIGRMPYGCLLLGDWRDDPFDAPGHADLKAIYSVGAYDITELTTCVLEVVEGVL